MERPRKETSERPGVCASARKLGARGEGDPREAKVSTGLGQAHRPGAQGGQRKRRPWWNEAPTSRIESARAGNSPPKVVRAADLSRPAPDQRQSVSKKEITMRLSPGGLVATLVLAI